MFRTTITRTAAAVIAAGTLGFAAPVASADIVAGPVIHGNGLDNVLLGTSAADDIFGYDGRDLIAGRAGNDRIDAGGSYDEIFPGAGQDVVFGGFNADDIYDDDNSTDKLSGGHDADLIQAANGTKDYVDCGDDAGIADDGDVAVVDSQDVVAHNCEQVIKVSADRGDAPVNPKTGYKTSFLMGTNSGEYLAVGFTSTGAVDDWISGKGGNDTLNGYEGKDTLFGGDGEDHVYGAEGDDTIVDDDNDEDHLSGWTGEDRIYALNGTSDVVNCGAGADIAYVDQIDFVAGCETVVTKKKLD